eukprot:UN04343
MCHVLKIPKLHTTDLILDFAVNKNLYCRYFGQLEN